MEVPLRKTLIFLEKSGTLAHQSRHLYEHDISLLYMKICTFNPLFSSVISNLSVIITFVIRMQYSRVTKKENHCRSLKKTAMVFVGFFYLICSYCRSVCYPHHACKKVREMFSHLKYR